MRILLIGDPHLKISKFNQCVDFLNWVEGVVSQQKPDMVINLGDTFDTHAVIRSEIMSEFIAHVRRTTETCPYYYLLGNHDMFKPDDSKYHALTPFVEDNTIKDFTVVDTLLNLGDITFVPYMHDWENFPKQTNDICIAHQTFVGADYGYYRPDVGVDADAISAKIIISGHVHKRQGFGKVYYPGTPFAQGLDDINQVKGVDIFDTNDYSFNFIQSPFPVWSGLKYEISSDVSVDDIHNDIANTVNDKDHWIVQITGPKAELVSYMDSDRFNKLKEKSSVAIRPEYNDKSKVVRKKIKSITTNEIIGDFVDNIYTGSIDKEEVKARALDIIKTV